MDEVKLCTDCKWRGALAGRHWCGAYPDAKRLKDARDQCQGNDWQRGTRQRPQSARNLYE